MRVVAIAALAAMIAKPAVADTMAHCSAAWKAKTPSAVAAGSYKDWSSICLTNKYTADFPESVQPAGATAMCKDNSYSTSKTAKGRCSGHGGVAKIL
jgi:hypothetical protein